MLFPEAKNGGVNRSNNNEFRMLMSYIASYFLEVSTRVLLQLTTKGLFRGITT